MDGVVEGDFGFRKVLASDILQNVLCQGMTDALDMGILHLSAQPVKAQGNGVAVEGILVQ